MEEKPGEVMNLLCSSMKLERDRGSVELEKLIPNLDFSQKQNLQNQLIKLLIDSDNSWETKYGCLLGAKLLHSCMHPEDDSDVNFMMNIKTIAQKMLTDIEVRVRIAAGEVLGLLCQKIGSEIYVELKDSTLKLIQSNLERNLAEDDSSRQEQFETEKLVEKLVGSSCPDKMMSDSAQYFQDTAGWKNLETSLKALQSMIEGCGPNFQPFVDDELLSLIFRTLRHPNRFVRETGYYVSSSLVSCSDSDEDVESRDSMSLVNPIYTFRHEFSKYLADGLADNWSQVRLAASVATRSFLLSLPNNGARQFFYPQLLPRMCLNRYFIADGVRIYSQETWRQVAGPAGKELVEQHIGPTVEYYKFAATSDNHAVREAACACISELASKISSSIVRPYVNDLLNTLLTCFQDDSWPVRDAACLACGNFVLCFPDESSAFIDSLYPMFYRNLSDTISSVRQGAASALCNVVRAYGEDALANVIARITEGLKNVKNQQPETEKCLDFERGPGKYGIIKRIRDSDNEFHSDKMGFCGSSYSSRLSRSRSYDKTCKSESQLWEFADGCIYLLGELSHIKEAEQGIISVVPLLKEAASHHHYTHHVIFLETICKQIPVLAKNLGKKVFRNIAEEFLDIIFYSLGCENALTSSAASQCISHLAAFLGPNILRAKVQNYNPNYGKQLESVIYIAPF